jgi:glutamate-5-semialdehyde dehydrogenase
MDSTAETKMLEPLALQVKRTRQAARELARLSTGQRNQVLLIAADILESREAEILKANHADVTSLEHAAASGMASAALLKRLRTSTAGIKDMARQIRDVAGLEDPVGRVLSITELDGDLTLQKVTCPLGVVAVIFETGSC